MLIGKHLRLAYFQFQGGYTEENDRSIHRGKGETKEADFVPGFKYSFLFSNSSHSKLRDFAPPSFQFINIIMEKILSLEKEAVFCSCIWGKLLKKALKQQSCMLQIV